jgi:pimeloyl-ACP methyl ester carboxylesterase
MTRTLAGTERNSVGKWSRTAPGGRTRRQVLYALSTTAATAALAGCLGDDSDDDPDDGSANDTDDGSTDQTDDGSDGNGDGDGTSETVPESFEDPDALREHTREYIELVATGEFQAASEWFTPAVSQRFSASDLERIWGSVVGAQTTPDSFRSVSHLGTELGNQVFTAWATIDSDEFQFLVSYSPEGVANFQITPVGEWTPPSYVDESAISEESVALETPLDCELPGRITLPEGEGEVPGVVIVHGNGPEDRNGTVGPNRPYKELAWGLASMGVAVLRYDKRTFSCEVDLADATIDDIVTEDALTAVERLRSHDRVADDGVYVCGHSFGGLLAPRITDRDDRIAGTVMLAPGPSRSMATLILEQTEHILEQRGVVGPQREEVLSQVEAEVEKMRDLDIGDDEIVRFGGREYHESLQSYDHEATVANLEVPVLLLQGGNDWQVTPDGSLPVWRDALADKENATITVYDELNHLFQESEPPLTQAEYAEPDSPVDEQVIEDIASFVSEAPGETVERAVRRPLLTR